MGEFKRKSGGWRIFTSDFKRATVDRIRSGAATLAEVSRELEIAPGILRNWMRLIERGGQTAVDAGEDVVPLSRVRELEKQVKDLQRLVGKQAMTIEILEAACDVAKWSALVQRDEAVTGHPTAAICRALHVARSTAYLKPRPRPEGFYRWVEDPEILLEIMAVVRERASYGVRRVHALLNRAPRARCEPPYDRKRIWGLMRGHALTLPGKIRRRDRPHTGTICRPDSNQRWCGDGLNIRC